MVRLELNKKGCITRISYLKEKDIKKFQEFIKNNWNNLKNIKLEHN